MIFQHNKVIQTVVTWQALDFRHALQHRPIFACGFKLGQLLCATGTMHVGLDQLPHNRMRLPAACWVNMFPTDIERNTYHLMFREVRAN